MSDHLTQHVVQIHTSDHLTQHVLQFQKDDIPPETLDATTHSTLMNLWTQRIHIEETLENLLNNSLDIDIDDEFERLDDIDNTINRRMFDTYRLLLHP